jgi:hypothetical protein
LVNLCEDLGFHNVDIEYRLHDGGSFVTLSGGFKRPDIETLRPNYLNLEILKIIGTIAALPADYECDDISRIEDYADETTDDTVCFYHHVLENTIEMLSEYCLKDLKENFEYQQTDEYIIDDIDCNGYVFNKNGIMESKI